MLKNMFELIVLQTEFITVTCFMKFNKKGLVLFLLYWEIV